MRESQFNLSGKKAIVTGGSQGVGEGIALELATAGADVAIVVDKNIEKARSVSEKVLELQKASIALRADLSVPTDVDRMLETVLKEFGALDILVNNAGVNDHAPAESMPLSMWSKIIAVDLDAVFLSCKAAGKAMARQRRGTIINISSISGGEIVCKGNAQCAYNAAKGGVVMLTRALAIEWAKYDIRVNCISPGFINTPLVEKYFDNYRDQYKIVIESTPMSRIGSAAEIGKAAVFLASEAGKYITGQNIYVDGGYISW